MTAKYRHTGPIQINGQWTTPAGCELARVVDLARSLGRAPQGCREVEDYFPTHTHQRLTITFDRAPHGTSWAYLTHPVEAPWCAYQEGDRVTVELGNQTFHGIVRVIREREPDRDIYSCYSCQWEMELDVDQEWTEVSFEPLPPTPDAVPR